MTNQGFYGALKQYWTVDEKPRLNRRNSWFEDHRPTPYDTLRIGIVAITLAMAIVGFWSAVGVFL